MGAPAVPPPEPRAVRLYFRDERNVSIPFAWASHDFGLIATDEGELLLQAPLTEVRRRKDAAILRIDRDLFLRMIGWWLHCMNAGDQVPGTELHRLIGFGHPERNTQAHDGTVLEWLPPSRDGAEDEFVRHIG